MRFRLNIASRRFLFGIKTAIPSDAIFNSHRTTNIASFSCLFFFRRLHLGLNICYFIYSKLKCLHFLSRQDRVRLLSKTVTTKRLTESDAKMMFNSTFWSYTREPSDIRRIKRHFFALVSEGMGMQEILKFLLRMQEVSDSLCVICPIFWRPEFRF